MKRKPLSKKLRFEVFKRDHFKCQYCGRMSPDVILEVDHIKPVAEGGEDDMLNLITSCRDCNRGKGKTRLEANEELKKQQQELEDLAEKREQTEMMLEWKQELQQLMENQIDGISDYIASMTKYGLGKGGRAHFRKLIKNFSFTEVFEAVEISFDYYYDGTDRSWDKAYDKVGGICYNRRLHNGEV